MNIKDKFKLLQWAEAIIWILIISLVIFGIRYHNYKEKKELKRLLSMAIENIKEEI